MKKNLANTSQPWTCVSKPNSQDARPAPTGAPHLHRLAQLESPVQTYSAWAKRRLLGAAGSRRCGSECRQGAQQWRGGLTRTDPQSTTERRVGRWDGNGEEGEPQDSKLHRRRRRGGGCGRHT
jgi:hypothetical protein